MSHPSDILPKLRGTIAVMPLGQRISFHESIKNASRGPTCLGLAPGKHDSETQYDQYDGDDAPFD